MKQGPTLGIVGGGQLGRMLTLAALPLGFKVVVVNTSPNSPAQQVGAEEIIGNLYDPKALHELATKADFITVEIEHLNADELVKLAKTGKPVNPAPEIIKLIQDKFKQKEFLDNAGVPVAPFVKLTDDKSALTAFKKFKGKMLIKTRLGAYDGRGNMVVETEFEIKKAFKFFNGRELYAEAFVPFTKELATMVARSIKGDVKVYPIVETVHKRNICVEVYAPAPVEAKYINKARAIALKVAKLLKGAGTFGIEMFLTTDGKVLVNEIAPRVHNSGHYTIEASRTSQFEQHVRAVTGLPLGEVSMVTPAAVMINILGERDGDTELKGLNDVLNISATSVHIYGKSPTKVDRKMGHITATGKSLNEASRRARQARKVLSI